MRGDVPTRVDFGDPRKRLNSRFVPAAVLVVTVLIVMIYIVGSAGDFPTDRVLSSQQVTDLESLTGRDRIWSIAMEEWARHPVFGYGSDLFDQSYRAAIQMPWAINGHNQVIDTLARSGLVGAAGLALYATLLFVFSVKFARASRGLSIAIFLTIAMRCVTEVPLGLFGYGAEALGHFLLLAIVAGNARARSAVVAARAGSDGCPTRRPRLGQREAIDLRANRACDG
jgi:O-antigen ligase